MGRGGPGDGRQRQQVIRLLRPVFVLCSRHIWSSGVLPLVPQLRVHQHDPRTRRAACRCKPASAT